MLVLCINYACNWVQITNAGRRYTCPMKEIDGEPYFRYKNQWHRVRDYTSRDYPKFCVKLPCGVE